MSANKNTLARYDAIDKCLSDDSRDYFIEDLIRACVLSIYGEDLPDQTITKRTIYKDLVQMETVYHAPIEREKVGHRTRIFYSRPFHFRDAPMTKKEARLLTDTLGLLSRFKGMPHFEWVDEAIARFEENFQLRGQQDTIVGFEHNPYLVGMEYFSPLFRAATGHQVVEIRYEPYGKALITFILHPYYLKQYNNRWFLFGLNDELQKVTNVALDRVRGVKTVTKTFVPNKDIDFDDYFDDVVGVSGIGGEVEDVFLEVDNTLMPYIASKPIHPSQTIMERGDTSTRLRLRLIPNYELRSLLLSYGHRLHVLSPRALKAEMEAEIRAMMENICKREHLFHT